MTASAENAICLHIKVIWHSLASWSWAKLVICSVMHLLVRFLVVHDSLEIRQMSPDPQETTCRLKFSYLMPVGIQPGLLMPELQAQPLGVCTDQLLT